MIKPILIYDEYDDFPIVNDPFMSSRVRVIVVYRHFQQYVS